MVKAYAILVHGPVAEIDCDAMVKTDLVKFRKTADACLDCSSAGCDINKGYRPLRLNGELKASYRQFGAEKIADPAKALSRAMGS